MRVLHVLDHSIPLHSGYSFRTRNILRKQRDMGLETFHLTGPKQGASAGSSPAEETVDDLHFFRTPPVAGWRDRLPLYRHRAAIEAMTRRLDEVVRRIRPDVIHAHSPALNGVAAQRVADRHQLPLLYEVRAFWEDAAVDHGTASRFGLRYRLSRALENRVLSRADGIVTICEGLRDDIVARGIAADKVRSVPNAVDPDQFHLRLPEDIALRRELGLEGATVLGFIGSFYAYEGLYLLIAALPRILEDHPEVRLLLVGGGPQERLLKALAEALGVAEAVVFTGRVPHHQVTRYSALVDIFVFPRMSMRLTELVTPLKPLEAMAQGKLVLASDVGGHRQLIRDGETGVLFPAGQPDGMAEAVDGLLRNRDQWPTFREKARAFVEQERTWDRTVAAYPPVYRGLTDRRAFR